MVTALVIGWVLAGVFAGFAAHQRQSLLEEKDESRDLQAQVVDLTEKLATARCESSAHETTIGMIMKEIPDA